MDGFFVAKLKKYADGPKKFNETLNEANTKKTETNEEFDDIDKENYDDELDRIILGGEKTEKKDEDKESSEYLSAHEFDEDEEEIKDMEGKPQGIKKANFNNKDKKNFEKNNLNKEKNINKIQLNFNKKQEKNDNLKAENKKTNKAENKAENIAENKAENIAENKKEFLNKKRKNKQ